MVLLLPLLWYSRPMLRTWAAVLGASIAAAFVPVLPTVATPSIAYTLGAYMVIDTLAALIVLGSPKGLAQRAIGLLSGMMVMTHTGMLIAVLRGSAVSTTMYFQANLLAGWLQLFCLAAWGGVSVGYYIAGRFWRRRCPPYSKGGFRG